MSSPFLMSDNPLKSTQLSSGHGVRTGLNVEDIKESFLDNLFYALNRAPALATKNDLYTALAMTVRDRVFHSSVRTIETYGEHKPRVVAYLSAEFLPGPHLSNNLLSLGITAQTRQALSELGYDLDELLGQEEEPGLGNGGLGRLASCFLDSLASLEIAAIGYGIRYEFGIFDQAIQDGWQTEITDKWLRLGNPWEICRPEIVYYKQNPTLCEVLDYIASGALAGGDAKLFQPLVENLLRDDPFLLLADYAAYVDCQNQVSALWCDPAAWTRKAILNVARMGKFSSDRSIRDYCERVWNVTPSPVKVE